MRTKHKVAIGCATILLVIATFIGKSNVSSPTIFPTPSVATPSASMKNNNLTPTSITGKTCDPTLWNHVYNPARLQVIESCKTVSGTIEVIRHEADGDQHILVKLDTPFANLINSVNTAKQHGDLVIEPICHFTPTQQDTLDQGVCNGFTQNFNVKVGDHVTITGAYVKDLEHQWNELHPVSSLTPE